jgi:hypothetical protein
MLIQREFDLSVANKMMTRKIMHLLVILFACSLLLSIAESLGAPMQDLRVLLSLLFHRLAAAEGVSTYSYVIFFGLTYLLAPFCVLYICKGDPLHQRWRQAIRKNGIVSIKKLIFLYVVGVPALVALIGASYYILSASRFHKSYNTAGAKLFESMTNSHASLVLVGPVVGVGIWLLCFLLITLMAVRGAQPLSRK